MQQIRIPYAITNVKKTSLAQMPPARKARKTEAAGAKEDELRVIQLREARALETKHAREARALEAKHSAQRTALAECIARAARSNTEAGTSAGAGAGPYGHCGQQVKAGGFLVCACCAKPICKRHEDAITKCEECDKAYCEACLGSGRVHRCVQCEEVASELVCCNLEQMPCGDWLHGECADNHCDNGCDCQG